MDMAVKNSIDGQAMVQSIESALNEVETILQRMREISVQAANDTNTIDDRRYLNTEFQALSAELTRMSSTAEFNGNKILDGTLSKNFQVGANGSDTIALAVDSIAAASLGNFTIDAGPQQAMELDDAITNDYDGGNFTVIGNGNTSTINAGAAASAKTYAAKINETTVDTGVSATAITEVSLAFHATDAAVQLDIGSASGSLTDLGTITVGSTNQTAFINAVNAVSSTTGITAKANATNDEVILTDIDGDDIYLVRGDAVADRDITIASLKSDGTKVAGATALAESGQTPDNYLVTGRVKLESSTAFTVDDVSDEYIGTAASTAATGSMISAAKLDTQANASSAIAVIDGAIEKLASTRATLGSLDSRLAHTASNLVNASAATNEALGKLRDADFSQESANLAKAQVLQQVGTAMLAQANAQPQLVLQLLQ
jgi:flagellin